MSARSTSAETIRGLGALLAALLAAPAVSAKSHGYSSEVVGEAEPPKSASVHRLRKEEILLLPRRNAEDLLRSTPGLSLVQHGSEGKGHQFFLRGFDAGHGSDFEITVDGIPLNEWSNVHGQGYLDLNFLVPEAIRSVEVTKGPFTLGQGPFAVAGSADYRLGVPRERRGVRVAYTAGSTWRHRGVLTLADPAGRNFLAVEGLHDEGFGENRDIQRGALLGRWEMVDEPRLGRLHLLGAAHVARFGLPGALREDEVRSGGRGFFDASDPLGRGSSDRALAALGWERRGDSTEFRALLHGSLRSLEVSENFTLFLHDPLHGDRRLQHQRSRKLGLRLDHRLELHRGVELESGAGLSAEVLRQVELHVDDDGRELGRERELSATQSLAHLAAGLRLQPHPALELFGGGRIDLAHVEAKDELSRAEATGHALALSPRLGAAWRFAPHWRLYASYGRGSRLPEARAFVAAEAPPMVRVDAAELGLRFRPAPSLEFGASIFGSYLERESVYDHVSGLFLDLAASRRLGGELEAELRPLPWLRLAVDLSHADARFVESGRPVPYAPWLMFGLRAFVLVPSGTEAGLRLRYTAPRHLPHGARGSSQVQADLRIARSMGPFQLALEVENPLGLETREGEFSFPSRRDPSLPASEIPTLHFSPAPPRNARLTFSAHFR